MGGGWGGAARVVGRLGGCPVTAQQEYPHPLSQRKVLSRLLLWQVSSKDEDFLDLSVDVEQNTSITHCLR